MRMSQKPAEDISFGEWLRQRRHILDLTQQELADQVGCARITLRRIEAGALRPSKELALILLDQLGIPKAEQEIWLRFARGLSESPEKSKESFTSQPTTNLPVLLTSFIGREKEQREIVSLLEKYHLVTLIGPGGVGKTRLSLEVGQEMLKKHHDGVWLVELAPVLDPLLVPRTTALAIGLRDESQRPVIDMLSDYLRDKQMLLILDNCEHVVDTCARFIDTLLKSCPGLKILATSRESLGIMGEATYRVPSLGLPDMEQSVENIRDYESVRLFEERAQLLQIGFLVTPENSSSVADICHRLDGIPLAIELAAARVKMFSTEQIAARLEQSFNLLTTGHRTSLPRHQTLQAAIDWSHDLLSPAEQTLFRRLSVFVNGWTLEAAESVCSDADIKSENVLDLLTQLINKSLVNTKERHNQSRYHMLETIRQYAHDKLSCTGEIDSNRTRNLTYFITLVEEAEPELRGPNQVEWFQRLELEHPNMRAALGWALKRDSSEAALRLCVALALFWATRGYITEGRQWLQQALGMVDIQQIQNMPTGARIYGYALNWASDLAGRQGDIAEAQTLAKRGLGLLSKFDDKQGVAFSLYNLGVMAHSQGDFEAARKFDEESLTLWRELNNMHGIASSLEDLGLITLAQGDYTTAQAIFEENLVVWEQLGGKGGTAFTLEELGLVAFAQGNYTTAQSHFEVSLTLHRDLNNKWGIVHVLADWASLALSQKQLQRSANLAGAVMALLENMGARLDEPEWTMYNNTIAALRSELDEATFAAAWAEGKAMSTEQAIAFALQED